MKTLKLEGIESAIITQALINYETLLKDAEESKDFKDTGIVTLELAKATTNSVLDKLGVLNKDED
jgi:hypothetical protein